MKILLPIAALLLASPALAEPVFINGRATGTTTWNAFNPVTQEFQDGTNGATTSFTSTSGSGQTGGGILGVCDLIAEVDADITSGFGPGLTLITYNFSSQASFDALNYNGRISCAVIVDVDLVIDEAVPFQITQTGAFGGSFTVRDADGNLVVDTSGILAPGIYSLRHSFGARAGNLPGDSPSQTQQGSWLLQLGGPIIPLPSAAALGLAGLALLAVRRSR